MGPAARNAQGDFTHYTFNGAAGMGPLARRYYFEKTLKYNKRLFNFGNKPKATPFN
jgi:hypothetical protein